MSLLFLKTRRFLKTDTFGLKADSHLHKSRSAAASIGCLFLICQLHIIAELVHHLYKGLIDDLLPALSDAVYIG